MRRTGRLLVATVITGGAVLLSAGVAQAGTLPGGGDDSDHKAHHKSHKSHSEKDDSDDSDDSDCGGCVRVEEECCEDDEPAHYEYEYECADGGLQDIPGFGAVPVVATSDPCGEDEE